jgi:hypothetical protein
MSHFGISNILLSKLQRSQSDRNMLLHVGSEGLDLQSRKRFGLITIQGCVLLTIVTSRTVNRAPSITVGH